MTPELAADLLRSRAEAASRDGGLPCPDDFVVASVAAAVAGRPDAEALLSRYAVALPAEVRACADDPVLGPLLDAPWPEDGRAPGEARLVAATDALLRHARAAGVASEHTWRAAAGAALRAGASPLALHGASRFGALPMVGTSRASREAVRRALAHGTPPPVARDLHLSHGLLHELTHGPRRPWRGPPGSWMLAEVAAGWLGWRAFARHVLPRVAGEATPGLRPFADLGRWLAARVASPDTLTSLALTDTRRDHAPSLARVARVALAAEWQGWRAAPPGLLAPDNRDHLGWWRLLTAAAQLDAGGPLPALLRRVDALPLERSDEVDGLPDLLGAARAASWDDLAPPAPAAAAVAAELHDAVAALLAVDRLTPEARSAPARWPDGKVILDVDTAQLRALPRADGVYAEPARAWVCPATVRDAARRGLRHLTLTVDGRDAAWRAAEALADVLLRGGPMPRELHLDLRAPSPVRPTPVPARRAPRPLGLDAPVLALGSCFAVNVGERLRDAGMPVTLNPWGTLYDPVSVARALRWSCSDAPLPDGLLHRDHGRWLSAWHHTDLTADGPDHGVDEAVVRGRVQAAVDAGRAAARAAHLVLLTWGTAIVHEDVLTGDVVANRHGLDPSRFRVRRLSVQEIVDETSAALAALRSLAPDAQVVLTISPVRHRLPAMDNTRSKAVLHLAAEALAADGGVDVFPAYEIMLDELRDHAWYDPDGVHPSAAAADLIASRFARARLTPEAHASLARRMDVTRELAALPRDPAARHEALGALVARLRDGALPVAGPTAGLHAWIDGERARLEQILGPRAERPTPEQTVEATPPPPPPSEGITPTLSELDAALAAPIEEGAERAWCDAVVAAAVPGAPDDGVWPDRLDRLDGVRSLLPDPWELLPSVWAAVAPLALAAAPRASAEAVVAAVQLGLCPPQVAAGAPPAACDALREVIGAAAAPRAGRRHHAAVEALLQVLDGASPAR